MKGIFTSVYPFMFPQRPTISESLPAEAAGVRPFARVDSNVDLLGAAGAKGFAWKINISVLFMY